MRQLAIWHTYAQKNAFVAQWCAISGQTRKTVQISRDNKSVINAVKFGQMVKLCYAEGRDSGK